MSFKSDRYLGNEGVSGGNPTPLSSSLNSASETTAATSRVVKELNDKIGNLSQEILTFTGDIDGGSFTDTPSVYDVDAGEF